MISRGSIVWADLGSPVGSAPAKRRPLVVLSADHFLRSHLATVVAAALTSNTALADLPGNVFVPSSASGLEKDSVVNVTQIVTLDRDGLVESGERIPSYLLAELDTGLRLSLGL